MAPHGSVTLTAMRVRGADAWCGCVVRGAVLDMGVRGAALATSLGQSCGTVYLVASLLGTGKLQVRHLMRPPPLHEVRSAARPDLT